MRYGLVIVAVFAAAGVVLISANSNRAAQFSEPTELHLSAAFMGMPFNLGVADADDSFVGRNFMAPDLAAAATKRLPNWSGLITKTSRIAAAVVYDSGENAARSLLLAAGAGLLLAEQAALNDAPLDPSAQKVLDSIRAAKSQYRPATVTELDSARAEVETAWSKLEQFVGADKATREGWESYLRGDDLGAELAKGKDAKPEVLRDIADRYRSGVAGLELPQFANVRHALRHYNAVLSAVRSPDARVGYGQKLDKLADSLDHYSRSANSADADAIGMTLGDLQDTRQADPVLQNIWAQFDKPNLYVRASADFLATISSDDLDENDPHFADNIEGTSITGTTHTVGKRTAVLLDGQDRAVMQIKLVGTTTSHTVGVHPPVTVYNTGTTTFTGSKIVRFDADGFVDCPAITSACTHTNIDRLCICGGRLVQRIATKKVYQAKPEAESIGARHAEQRVSKRLDEGSKDNLETQNRNFKAKIHDPLMRWGAYPNLRYSSKPDAMWIVARESGPAQLGAPAGPTQEIAPATLNIQLHESFVNNLTALTLGGRTINREQLEAALNDMFGEVPKELADDKDQEKQWTITFAKEHPVTATFADNGYSITIRGTRYTSISPNVEREFIGGPMNVSAKFKFDKGPNGPVGKRQGDLEFVVPGMEGQQFSSKQVALKKLLQNRFGKILKPTMEFNGLEFKKAPFSKAGRLVSSQLSSDSGWLTAGWVKETDAKK